MKTANSNLLLLLSFTILPISNIKSAAAPLTEAQIAEQKEIGNINQHISTFVKTYSIEGVRAQRIAAFQTETKYLTNQRNTNPSALVRQFAADQIKALNSLNDKLESSYNN